jgi:hypothetical protein
MGQGDDIAGEAGEEAAADDPVKGRGRSGPFR